MELTYQINVPIGTQTMQLTTAGNLAASTVSAEQGFDGACVIDYFEFATNSIDKVRLLIKPNGGGNLLAGIFKNGSGFASSIRANNIVNESSGMWDVLEYNTSTNVYKFRLKLPLYFPKGVLISLENTGTASQTAGFYCIMRKLQ